MFCVGHYGAYISIAMQDGILIIRMYGDTLADDILDAFRIAYSKGWLQPDNRSLVDIRLFIGSIDWGMLRAINKMTPWSSDGSRRSSHCAYLFGDSLRDWFLSIVAAIYPGAGHRKFDNEAAALAWLTAIGAVREIEKQSVG